MGLSTAAYRIGIFLAGTITLFLHEKKKIPWPLMFKIISVFVVLLNWTIVFAPKEKPAKIKTINEAFVRPYKEIIQTYGNKLLGIVLFMVFYKIEERFVAPMESIFLRENLKVHEYTVLKFVSTFALAFAAVKSGKLITKFGYKKTFVISILAGVGLVFCYLLCSIKTPLNYVISILIGIGLFLTFYRIRNSRTPYWLVCILAISLPLGSYFKGVPLNMVAIFTLVVTAKMISGIRNSLFYSYQCSLASKENALSQIAIITSLERIITQPMGMLSGFCVDKYGWIGFYSINLCMTLLPILVMRFAHYPKMNSK
jgi:MFS family permease